jgi:hypothetical protein
MGMSASGTGIMTLSSAGENQNRCQKCFATSGGRARSAAEVAESHARRMALTGRVDGLGSWMAFGSDSVITRQAIRRGSFTSVKELTATIGDFIDHWNDHPRPFAWTKDADEILAKITRAKTRANVAAGH